jgi:hypothetical protein
MMVLEKLKITPRNLILLIIALLGLVIFILINQLIFSPLGRLVVPYGILDFEFAWTSEQVQVIFAAWGPGGILLQLNGVYWDFLYILGYVLFIFSCIVLVSRRLTGKLQTIGLYMSLTPILAGLFDVIENINLIIMLINPTGFQSIVPVLASTFALMKFAVLLVGIIYFFISLILVIIRLLKKKI